MNEVYAFPFENMPDMIRWKWSNCGKFTTSSVYEQLTKNDSGNNFKHIWKTRIPHKIKIFLWLVEQNAILTKDNMIRRKWAGVLNATSVYKMNQWIIYFFNAP